MGYKYPLIYILPMSDFSSLGHCACCLGDNVSPMTYPQKPGLEFLEKKNVFKKIDFLSGIRIFVTVTK
jgi:hypothetical protein